MTAMTASVKTYTSYRETFYVNLEVWGEGTTASIFESYPPSKQIHNGAPTPSKNEALPLKLNIPLPLKNEVPFLKKLPLIYAFHS